MAARGYRNQGVIPLGSSSGPLSVARNSVTLGPAESQAGANIDGMVTGKFYVDITWRSSITDFAFADVTIENGTASASDLTGSGRIYRIGITPAANSSGIVTLTIAEDAVRGGNDFSTRSYGYSTAAPIANAAYVRFDLPDGVQTGTTYNIDCTFRKGGSTVEVVGFTNSTSDIVTEGISGATQIITTRGWELTLPSSVTNLVRGNVSVTGNTVSSVRRVGTSGQDAQRWVITLTGGTNGGFRETLPIGAVTIVGQGSVGRPTSIRSRAGTYRIVVTPPDEENGTLNTIIRRGAVNVASDNVASPGFDTNSGSVAFDTRTPVTFTLGDPENVSGGTLTEPLTENVFYVDITADKQASVFEQSDVVVSNACVASFSTVTTGRAWRIGLNPNAEGSAQITLSIGAGSVSEGNHTAFRGYSFLREPPSPAWQLPNGIQRANFNIPITFRNGPGATTFVTGLASTDFTVTGISGAVVELHSSIWRFRISQDVDSFTVSNISITNSTVTNVSLDDREVTITLSEARGSLQRGDISLTGLRSSGTLLSPQPTVTNVVRRNYILNVMPPANQEGTLNIVMARDSCTSEQGIQGPNTTENSGSVAFDTLGTEPTVVRVDWPDTIELGMGTFGVDLDWNVPITDFTTSDIRYTGPDSCSITSIAWGDTSIMSQPDMSMRTYTGTLANVGSDGKAYYRITLTKTSAYAGENITLDILPLAVRGPVYSSN